MARKEIVVDSDVRKKKLRFRAAHRGIRELDLFIGAFAEARLETMDEGQLDEFEQILDIPDQLVMDWITGRSIPEEEAAGPLLCDLLQFDYASQRKA